MRQLATVREISEINPIPEADAIECAVVDGWKVVVRKGEFKTGDKVVYCEIDSFLPVKEEYEFLRKSSYKKLVDGSEGFRLRSIKLRGQISQGLLLPLSVLPGEVAAGGDVTEILGITKYEAAVPVEISGDAVGRVPEFIRKTDEERIQNLKSDYLEFQEYSYHVEEKLDGTSCTFFWKDTLYGVCSRNYELKEDANNTLWKLFNEHDLRVKLAEYGKNIALQGEVIGNGIQGNKYKLLKPEFRLFNVWDIDNQKYLDKGAALSLALDLGLNICPVTHNDRFYLPKTIDELLSMAEGKSAVNPAIEREGLVFVAFSESKYISFKVINNKFLLKYEE